MRRRWPALVILAVLFAVCLPLMLTMPGFRADAEPVQEAEPEVDVEGMFTTFTQEDYTSGLRQYAEDEVRLVLSETDLTEETTGVITNAVGTIVDQDGELPIPNAMISVINGETGVLTATIRSDAYGRFQVVGLPDEYYNWSVIAPGYQPAAYYGYDVRAGEITDIFCFHVSRTEAISHVDPHVQGCMTEGLFTPYAAIPGLETSEQTT